MATPAISIPPRRSMAFFAGLAILMSILSYVFLLSLAVASVYLPFLVLQSGSANWQILLLFLFGIAIAAALIWSMIPRRDKFTPPGPRLGRDDQPRLFAELDRIAAALGQPVPSDVYLIADMNAYVADRGGVMGFGSQRIMGLGLPLLSVLTIPQFRAVLAHEFAHFYGGDTRLGPWVYKARQSIIHTFENMESLRGLVRLGILQLMYVVVMTLLKWYFIAFLRVTSLISRRQEFRADELACLVAGNDPLISGLRTIQSTGPAWPTYWNTEVSPLLSFGTVPTISEGFARFVAAPSIAMQIDKFLANRLNSEKVKPYDTHPPLRDRIREAQKLPLSLQDSTAPSARTLLTGVEVLEMAFLKALDPKIAAQPLIRVEWDDIVPLAALPMWTDSVNSYSGMMRGYTLATLPKAVDSLPQMESQIRNPKGMLLNSQQRFARAADLLAMALGLALHREGWTLQVQPATRLLKRGDFELNPFIAIAQLVNKETSPEVWRTLCQTLGIADLPLVPPDILESDPAPPGPSATAGPR